MKQRQINTREFEQFYEKTAGAIRAYILRHCGNVSAVDDLFQITYTKFLNSRMAATPLADGASAYLYRIVSNTITDHGRWLVRNRHHEIPLTDSMTAKQSEPTTSQVTLRNGLRNLSNREQRLLWLAYAEGFTHKEVANIMNLSENSVRVLLFRARHRLASAMGHTHDSKGGI